MFSIRTNWVSPRWRCSFPSVDACLLEGGRCVPSFRLCIAVSFVGATMLVPLQLASGRSASRTAPLLREDGSPRPSMSLIVNYRHETFGSTEERSKCLALGRVGALPHCKPGSNGLMVRAAGCRRQGGCHSHLANVLIDVSTLPLSLLLPVHSVGKIDRDKSHFLRSAQSERMSERRPRAPVRKYPCRRLVQRESL